MRAATATRNAAYAQVAAEEEASAEGSEAHLGQRQQRVFDVIRVAPDITNSEISRVLGWTINKVTPRCKELRDKGLVVAGRKRRCTVTGETVQAWRAAAADPRYNLNPCVRLFGFGPEGTTCKSCRLLRTTPNTGGTYYKCSLRANTRGAATDHRVGWSACGKYEEAASDGQ